MNYTLDSLQRDRLLTETHLMTKQVHTAVFDKGGLKPRMDKAEGGIRAIIALIGVCGTVGLFSVLGGCATVKDNEVSAIKIQPSQKSTTSENIEAGGRVLAGAWDRLTKQKETAE